LIDSVDEVPAVTLAGANDALTPAGIPDADNDTDCAAPLVIAVDTVAVAPPPAATVPLAGATLIEKSLAPPFVTIACAIRQSAVSFDHVACIGKEPFANATFCAPPVPPVPFHAHLSAFS